MSIILSGLFSRFMLSRNHSLINRCNSHIVVGTPCLLIGGTERQTLMLVGAVKHDYRVTLVCYHEYENGVVEEFRKIGAEVVLLNWKRSIQSMQFVFRLSQIFRDLDPDVVHIQYMAPGFLPIIAARLAGVRRVLSTINYPRSIHGFMACVLVNLAALLCSRFVCVSGAVEESWFGSSMLLDTEDAERIKFRHISIYNAVDVDYVDSLMSRSDINSIRSRLGLNNELVVGAVARLSMEKGVDILIKAFARVHAKMPGARLLVVGQGEERASLMSLASKLGVVDSVIWVGGCSWEEAIQYLSIMDLVVVPSRYEGFGLVAVEAMACAKPVVASDVDGLQEIVDNGVTGFLVSAGNVEALENAIVKLLSSAEIMMRMGLTGKEMAEQRFGLDLFERNWRRLYSGLFDVR